MNSDAENDDEWERRNEMSTSRETPRTEAIWSQVVAAMNVSNGYEHRKAHEEAARIGIEDLETELNELKAEARKRTDFLRARVGELEKDKERLDWLARTYYVAQNSTYRLPWNKDSIMGYGTDHTINIRQAIDEARKGEK